eukprot:2189241-Prymnesium_polylepis.5
MPCHRATPVLPVQEPLSRSLALRRKVHRWARRMRAGSAQPTNGAENVEKRISRLSCSVPRTRTSPSTSVTSDTAQPRLSAADMSENDVSAMMMSSPLDCTSVGALSCGVWPTTSLWMPLSLSLTTSSSCSGCGMHFLSSCRPITTEGSQPGAT